MPWGYAPCKAVFPVILPPSVVGLTKAIKRNVLQPPLSLVATRTPKAHPGDGSPAGDGTVDGSPRLPAEVPASLGPEDEKESACEGCRLWSKVPSVTDALCGPRSRAPAEDDAQDTEQPASEAPASEGSDSLPPPSLPEVVPVPAPADPAPALAAPRAPPPPSCQAGDEPAEAGDSGEEATEVLGAGVGDCKLKVLDAAVAAAATCEAQEDTPRTADDAPARSAEGNACPSSTSSSSESSAAAAPAPKAKTCDKCDGKHPTESCPHFKKPREDHKDAWLNYNRKKPIQMGKSGGNVIVRNCKCVPQPGDGSCLFHSLCYGLNGGKQGQLRAGDLRWELANFIESNPQLEIAGDTIEEWVRWDANTAVTTYARRMAVGGWGGGIEMAACSLMKKVNVHVYERRWLGGYRRISCFDCPEPTERNINVLYQGGMHYDALVTCS